MEINWQNINVVEEVRKEMHVIELNEGSMKKFAAEDSNFDDKTKCEIEMVGAMANARKYIYIAELLNMQIGEILNKENEA